MFLYWNNVAAVILQVGTRFVGAAFEVWERPCPLCGYVFSRFVSCQPVRREKQTQNVKQSVSAQADIETELSNY